MKKHIALLCTALLVLALLTGCGAKSASLAEDTADATTNTEAPHEVETDDVALEEDSAENGFSLPETAELHQTERKIIYTADYTISSKQFDTDYKKILAAMEEVGGYLSNESTDGTRPEEYGDPGRTANFSLRIPLEAYTTFLDTISGIGTVESKSQYTDDVTTEYYDNEARLELYEEHYKKLMEYLDKATSIEDMMSIESQITETLYTIDTLKGTKSYYDNMTQYTTVNIYLRENVASSEVPVSKQSLGGRISDSFHDVTSALGVFFEGLIIVLVSGAPVWGILLVIFAAIFIPIRLHKKKARKNKPEQPQDQEETKKLYE